MVTIRLRFGQDVRLKRATGFETRDGYLIVKQENKIIATYADWVGAEVEG